MQFADILGGWLVQLGLPADTLQKLEPTLLLSWGKTLALVVLTILIGRLALRLMGVLVDRTITTTGDQKLRFLSQQRANTLRGLLKNVASYVTNFIIILTVLQLFGIPTEHVLAGAGIVGLAVGFGAQNLVKDIITGFFLLYEDQFGVGDVVELAGVSGTVEEMGFRVTRIRDFDGSLHIIPNGDIGKVNNRSRGTSRFIVDVDIAYEEDVDAALAVLQELCDQYVDEVVTDGPTVLGVSALGASSVTIKVFARTLPQQHWGAERRFRLAVKKRLDEEGIEIPYQRLVVVPAEATRIKAHGGNEQQAKKPNQGDEDHGETPSVSTE